jgi:hypothetical protein
MTVVSTVPTIAASYTTYVAPQQNAIHVSCTGPYAYCNPYNMQFVNQVPPTMPYATGHCTPQMCSQHPQQQYSQPVKESCEVPHYTIYYVNGFPYVCYAHQPEILFPIQMVDQEQNKERLLPELVSAIADATGEALQQQVASLENYVQNMEQQAVSKVEEKVKKSCLSCIM